VLVLYEYVNLTQLLLKAAAACVPFALQHYHMVDADLVLAFLSSVIAVNNYY